MKLPTSSIRFVCGLSNGETLVEGKGLLERVDGEKSPWWKLQDYIQENQLKIHSFYLSSGDRHFVLPGIGGKFNEIEPLGYNCFRTFKGDALGTGGDYEHYICAEALYPEMKVQLWLDERDHNKSWVSIVEVSDEKHS